MYDFSEYVGIVILIISTLIVGVLSIVLVVACLSFVFSHVKAYEMQQTGYDAKAVGLSCYVKYKGAYIDCDQVTGKQVDKHQIEITQEGK
jgi:hypothetical protein